MCRQRMFSNAVVLSMFVGVVLLSSHVFLSVLGLPGQMCDLRPDAVPCRNEAQCINNYCTCPSNRVISGSSCVQYLGDALPGQSCQNSGMICRGEEHFNSPEPTFYCQGGSSCNQNVCQCAAGFQPNAGRCTPIIEVRFTMVPVTTAMPAIVINRMAFFKKVFYILQFFSESWSDMWSQLQLPTLSAKVLWWFHM